MAKLQQAGVRADGGVVWERATRTAWLAVPTNAALDVAVASLLNRALHLAGGGEPVRFGQPTDTLVAHVRVATH